jgi:hypothetical protein
MASAEDQALVRELKDRLSQRRWLQEREWFGNILFHAGLQWTVYDTSARRWRQRKLSPAVPTPVTNLFRSTIDTVKSVLAQHDPRFLGTPMRDDPNAVASASAADEQLQVLLQEGRFRPAKRRMLDWLMTTGNGAIEAVWDNSDETGTVEIPKEECLQCGTISDPDKIDPAEPQCPKCGSTLLRDSDQTVTTPRGSMRFDTHGPFELYMDPSIEENEDQPFQFIIKSFTTEQIKMAWDVDLDETGDYDSTGTNLRDQIAGMGSPGMGAVSIQQGIGDRQHRVIVYRAFIKEHKEYKDGAYICMTSSGKLLDRSVPYPWKRKVSGKKFYPFTHFRFATTGGKAWGYSPADDMRPKQYQLNKAESLLTMIIARMANPVWVIPANANPTKISGEIGIQVEYTGNQPPTRVPGAEAPRTLVQYIADIRQSFEELSGAFAAVKGKSTGSRTPVGTTQSMVDRGFGRWATVFDMLEEGYEDLAKKSLEVWRMNAKSPRIRAVENAIGGWTFHEFMASDWDDGVDIKVEAGSARPKTQQEKLQTYISLGESGMLDMTDKAQVIKVLEDTGMLNMIPGVQEDTKQAYRENAEFMQWAKQLSQTVQNSAGAHDPQTQQAVNIAMSQPPILVHPLVDAHDVHFLTHRRLCLTDEFKGLPQICQKTMFDHMMQHQMDFGQSTIHMPAGPIASGARPMPQKPQGGNVPVTSGG